MKNRVTKRMFRNMVSTTAAAAILGVSLCACGAGPADTAAEEAAPANAAEAESGQEAAPADPAGADSEQKTAEAAAEATEESVVSAGETGAEGQVRPLYSIHCFSDMETEGNTMIASSAYEIPQLTEEAAINYPALNKMLDAAGDEISARVDKAKDEVEEAAETAFRENGTDDNFMAGEVSARIEPVRCDASVLSFYELTSLYYPGAAHGTSGYETYNFNTASGAEITLTDVFKDPAALQPVIAENLRAVADGSEVRDEDGLLQDIFADGYDDLDWVLDRNGVTFLFAPYEVAPYAVGPVEAKISFRDHEDLFTGTYGPAEGGYITRLQPDVQQQADLDGDGSAETFSVSGIVPEGENSYGYDGLEVKVGDRTCVTEDMFYALDPYLVHTEDGGSFLYVVTTYDNDYTALTVFDIGGTDPAEAGTVSKSGTAVVYHQVLDDDGEVDMDESFSDRSPLLDPACMYLSTAMNLMSTYSAFRAYRAGGDGMPVPLTDYYEISSGITLTSKVALTGEVVDTQTGQTTGEEKEIPAGSKCSFWHTNGTDTVDMMLEDGTAVRFHVTREWPQTVNGIDLLEAFDGTMFAG